MVERRLLMVACGAILAQCAYWQNRKTNANFNFLKNSKGAAWIWFHCSFLHHTLSRLNRNRIKFLKINESKCGSQTGVRVWLLVAKCFIKFPGIFKTFPPVRCQISGTINTLKRKCLRYTKIIINSSFTLMKWDFRCILV